MKPVCFTLVRTTVKLNQSCFMQLEYGVCTFRVEGLVVVLDCQSVTTMQVSSLCTALTKCLRSCSKAWYT